MQNGCKIHANKPITSWYQENKGMIPKPSTTIGLVSTPSTLHASSNLFSFWRESTWKQNFKCSDDYFHKHWNIIKGNWRASFNRNQILKKIQLISLLSIENWAGASTRKINFHCLTDNRNIHQMKPYSFSERSNV